MKLILLFQIVLGLSPDEISEFGCSGIYKQFCKMIFNPRYFRFKLKLNLRLGATTSSSLLPVRVQILSPFS